MFIFRYLNFGIEIAILTLARLWNKKIDNNIDTPYSIFL